jgi:hypothetical protein
MLAHISKVAELSRWGTQRHPCHRHQALRASDLVRDEQDGQHRPDHEVRQSFHVALPDSHEHTVIASASMKTARRSGDGSCRGMTSPRSNGSTSFPRKQCSGAAASGTRLADLMRVSDTHWIGILSREHTPRECGSHDCPASSVAFACMTRRKPSTSSMSGSTNHSN